MSTTVQLSILNNTDSVEKILVYAFGAFDRYYICWQDKGGEYRQESHGLPPELHDWLFPANGSTRDLDTLQVFLFHNDEFFAFDKNDKISDTKTPPRDAFAGHRTRRGVETIAAVAEPSPKKASLRRAQTLSTMSPPGEMPSLRTSRIDDRAQKRRPRSIAIGSAPRWPWQEKHGFPMLPLPVLPSSPADNTPRPNSWSGGVKNPSRYVDVSIQTDPLSPLKIDIPFGPCSQSGSSQRLKQRSQPRSHSSSLSSLGSSDSLASAESIESTTTVDSGPLAERSVSLQNPVSMGALQDYFREKSYRLGDSLRRAPRINWT